MWIDTILQGVLLGGLYALFATGLSLSFGIMRLVNIAHGDFIVLAAYGGVVAVDWLGVPLFASIAVVVPLMAALGYVLQRLVLNHTLGQGILPPLLVTFGISVIIQNVSVDGLLGRFAGAEYGRLPNRKSGLGWRLCPWLVPPAGFRDGGRRHCRTSVFIVPYRPRTGVSCHLRRSANRSIDGGRQPLIPTRWRWP